MEFLGSLLRGEAPLTRVYWLYGAVGSFFFFFIPMTLFAGVDIFAMENPAVLALLAIYGLGFAPTYIVIISIGIWRSANAYQGRSLWALLAKVSVVLGIFEAVQEISKIVL